jgi:transcriptional regulator with XRE-family HTH domain
MDIKALRVRALRRLIGQSQLKDFANEHDLDPSYLSQILNGHRGMGEKAAATMADKIGVHRDLLVNPAAESSGDESEGQAGQQNPAATAEKSVAGTSKSAPVVLKLIAAAIADGTLTASDTEELRRLAVHFIKKNTELKPKATEVPEKLRGLAASALTTDANGGNTDDLLRMLEHGMSINRTTDSKPTNESKKKRSN